MRDTDLNDTGMLEILQWILDNGNDEVVLSLVNKDIRKKWYDDILREARAQEDGLGCRVAIAARYTRSGKPSIAHFDISCFWIDHSEDKNESENQDENKDAQKGTS